MSLWLYWLDSVMKVFVNDWNGTFCTVSQRYIPTLERFYWLFAQFKVDALQIVKTVRITFYQCRFFWFLSSFFLPLIWNGQSSSLIVIPNSLNFNNLVSLLRLTITALENSEPLISFHSSWNVVHRPKNPSYTVYVSDISCNYFYC